MREKKLGDVVWTGRIESVTCLRSQAGPAAGALGSG